MTKDEIIEMARQAGMNIDVLTRCHNIELLEPFVKIVAQQAQAEEREACAKVCEEDLRDEYLRQDRPVQDEVNLLAAIADCASAIRARGQA